MSRSAAPSTGVNDAASASVPSLAVGTVQFGCVYGIAGKGARVADREAKAILAMAHESGVRMLDTAPAYGDIEERLVALFPRGAEFVVTSKIAPLPPECLQSDADPVALAKHLRGEIDRSVSRLRGHLRTLLFHRAEDLDGPMGAAIWNAASERTRAHGLRLGVSLYDVRHPPSVCKTIDVAQCPANVFDQRILEAAGTSTFPREIHVRSAFLQGLLLMDQNEAVRKLPAAVSALQKWRDWCNSRSVSAIGGALGFAKSLPARYCVLGVESKEQFAEITTEWNSATPVTAADLSVDNLAIIDPRTWRVEK